MEATMTLNQISKKKGVGSSHFTKKMTYIYCLLTLASAILLSGCYASGQKNYDSYKYSAPTSFCQVIWVHSFEAAKYKLDNELPSVELLGKSSFSTEGIYNEKTARTDCQKAGGDYIIVISEGMTGSSQSHFTVQNDRTYTSNSQTNYYGSNGNYYGRSKTNTSYTVPTYQTFEITTTYYGYSYYVYKRVSKALQRRRALREKRKTYDIEEDDEDDYSSEEDD